MKSLSRTRKSYLLGSPAYRVIRNPYSGQGNSSFEEDLLAFSHLLTFLPIKVRFNMATIDNLVTPVLILDQFEEFFAFHEKVSGKKSTYEWRKTPFDF
jgi:hypothetical protein